MGESLRAFLALLKVKLADQVGNLRSLTPQRILRVFFSLGVIASLCALVYRFDLHVFSYFMGMPDLGRLVIARFFELGFLLFFVMLLFSAILTALSTLYPDQELHLLFSSP
ncbi:MAG: hypothetical protein ABH878_01105, partial [bacterium]